MTEKMYPYRLGIEAKGALKNTLKIIPKGHSLRGSASRVAAIACLLLIALSPATSAQAQGFTEVTTSAGITHVHATAEIMADLPAPAFMAGGVAAGDFDGDGLTDMIFSRLNDTDIFYRNRGDGTFEPRTASAGFSTPTLTNGVSAGDIDNDGDLDVYMTTTDGTRNYLYLNNGAGVFTDAGIGNVATHSNGVNRFGQGSSFGDYDGDGNLDLVTGAWGADVANDQSRVFRNLGGAQLGQFEDTSVATGTNVFRLAKAWRFTPRFLDLDRDGHQDLAIASDFRSSQLFWNNGDGTFIDGTEPANVGTDLNGMGSTFADYDGDGDLDWFITNITNSPDNPGAHGGWNRLYRNDGNRQFTDVTQEAGVRDSRWAWGTTFFDYDNDGDFDLIATNGWNGTGWSDDRTTLWRNDDGVFTDVSDSQGITDTLQGRGLAHLDYDNDGDLDIVVVNNEAAPVLYRNDNTVGNFIRIDVEGTQSNRDGVGAWITVIPDLTNPSDKMVWEIDGGSSFLSRNEQTAHFGLGDHGGPVDQVSVVWPSGIVQKLYNLDLNQTHNIIETLDWQVGDFNSDGAVDGMDYALWRETMGSTSDLRADGNGNGSIDSGDYNVWHNTFGFSAAGTSSGDSSSGQVPEPGVAWLLASSMLACQFSTRTRRRAS